MRFAFLAFSLFIGHALAAQTNPDYDPDFDGNGCYTVLDILSFLVILMPDDAGMDSPNPDYDPDYDDNGELTVMDLTGMLTWFGECAPTLLCESPTMDGHSYAVVTIGDQCWFAENLRTTVYGNGDLIPAGLTDGEWTDLVDYITSQGFVWTEGMALKSTTGWYDGGNGTDDFGFSAHPGGIRGYDSGIFLYAGLNGDWWSSSPDGDNGLGRNLDDGTSVILPGSGNPRIGCSVRCLRDAE